MKKDVGYRIRKLRESKDYSQENMAEELNISVSAYSKIERGVTDPSIGRLAEIAKILDVEVMQFIGDATVSNKLEDKDKIYGFVTKDEIDEVRRLIKQMKAEMISLKKEIAIIKTTKPPKKK